MSRNSDPTAWLFESLSRGLMFKLVLVLVVLPAMALITMRLWNLLTFLVIEGAGPADASWKAPVAGVLAVTGVVAGLTAGVLVCRELWPKRPQP